MTGLVIFAFTVGSLLLVLVGAFLYWIVEAAKEEYRQRVYTDARFHPDRCHKSAVLPLEADDHDFVVRCKGQCSAHS